MTEGELGKSYDDGEVICSEGAKGEVMYVVQSGEVHIQKKTDYGELTIATLKSGDIFGEMAIFDRRPRSATAVASGETHVLSVNKQKLFQTIDRDPTLVFKMLESMSQRIRSLNEDLAQLKKDKAGILDLCTDIKISCELVIKEARNVITADNGSIMLLDGKSGLLKIKAAFGKESGRKVEIIPGEGIAGNVFLTGNGEGIEMVTDDPRYLSGEMQIRSMLCVPLAWREQKLGVMNLSNTSEKSFTDNDLKLLTSLGNFASVAILNSLRITELGSATDVVLKRASILSC
ncbi:MAG: cyclic nucleotide-binding domain-containing protein [Nitrospiraceae bacterium]|nr:MAG: cyclic nucleotide-binding domain-containing protein [Nitrospiraceae bacterium]